MASTTPVRDTLYLMIYPGSSGTSDEPGSIISSNHEVHDTIEPPQSCLKKSCKIILPVIALGGALTGIVLNSMAAAELFSIASKLTGPVTWKAGCVWAAAAGTTGVAAGITTVVGISLLQAFAPSCSKAAGDGPRNTWGSWWGANVRNTALTVGCVSAIGSMAAQIALAGAGPWCTLAIPIVFLGYSALHNTCCPTWAPRALAF